MLVLSEIDPALNTRANPATFDMRKYAPRYFLINGKAYPDTDPIPTVAGHRVLLRYVNAGNQYHSMAVLGAHQSVIALDGSPLSASRSYVAETFGPGQTSDAIVTAPAATADARLAVYDGSLLLHSSNTAGFGGMLTFVAAAGAGGGTDTAGPGTTNVAYAAGTLTATVDDSATGGATVAAAAYFVDSVTGTGTAMTRQLRRRQRRRHCRGHSSRRSAHPLRPRPGLARQLGPRQLGAGQRRRRRRPGHDIARADPEPHQRHRHRRCRRPRDRQRRRHRRLEHRRGRVLHRRRRHNADDRQSGGTDREPGRHDSRRRGERPAGGHARRVDPQPGRAGQLGRCR